MKQIYDPVHGFIPLTPLMVQIIDTPAFQRLRDLKQLGATYFVFPSATHTRFEHSVGVSKLAYDLMSSLQRNQPDLNISARTIELVQIAGLIHDLGHGPFSHLYDHHVRKDDEPEHEERGCTIFRQLVSSYNVPLTPEEVQQIIRMICPTPEDGWIYQIVANVRTQIDVDKIDYIQRDSFHLGLQTGGEFKRLITQCRVIDDTICFPTKMQYDIYALFAARYRLHKQVYHHHAVVAYEFIITEILEKIMEKKPDFLDLTDSVVTCRLHSEYKDALERMAHRHHFRLLAEKRVDSPPPRLTKAALRASLDDQSKLPRLRFHQHTIGFVSGNKSNPLENISFYADKEPNVKFKLDPKKNSFIIPDKYQETILRLYSREKIDAPSKELINHCEIMLEKIASTAPSHRDD